MNEALDALLAIGLSTEQAKLFGPAIALAVVVSGGTAAFCAFQLLRFFLGRPTREW